MVYFRSQDELFQADYAVPLVELILPAFATAINPANFVR